MRHLEEGEKTTIRTSCRLVVGYIFEDRDIGGRHRWHQRRGRGEDERVVARRTSSVNPKTNLPSAFSAFITQLFIYLSQTYRALSLLQLALGIPNRQFTGSTADTRLPDPTLLLTNEVASAIGLRAVRSPFSCTCYRVATHRPWTGARPLWRLTATDQHALASWSANVLICHPVALPLHASLVDISPPES